MPPDPRSRRTARRGQTMVEFAITLPVMLMLLFGIIEFGRLFQAWLTLQNAARTAVRYGVTGAWDPLSVQRHTGSSLTDETILDELVPCEPGNTARFLDHWGVACNPDSDFHYGLRVDMARLPSIVDRARQGAAGLELVEGDNIVGMLRGNGSPMDSEPANAPNEPGWFHVSICSSRPPIVSEGSARYLPSADRNERQCQVIENVRGTTGFGPLVGDNQYDAGGPGDYLEVVIHYNAPLITPLNALMGWVGVDYINMAARRVGVNEAFRPSQVVNLPPHVGLPTPQPSTTPVFTAPPPPNSTATKVPEITLTPTNTGTLQPSATPQCSDLEIAGASLTGSYLQIRVRNRNPAPVYITGANVVWRRWSGGEMYAAAANVVGNDPHWTGIDLTPPTNMGPAGADGVWIDDPDLREFGGNSAITVWQVRFQNGPPSLSSAGYSIFDFAGTTLSFGGGAPCIMDVGLVTATPDMSMTPDMTTSPTETSAPQCSDFQLSFERFEPAGVVVFRLRNLGSTTVEISAFSVAWAQLTPSMFANQIEVGAFAFGSASNTVMWVGSDSSPPTSATASGGGDPSWNITPVIAASESLSMYVDFDGLGGPGTLSDYGGHRSDFNGTNVRFGDCTVGVSDVSTPVTPPPSVTPTYTRTPGPPTATFPPSNTPQPTSTFPTATPTRTWTPSSTPIPSITPSPTETFDFCFEC